MLVVIFGNIYSLKWFANLRVSLNDYVILVLNTDKPYTLHKEQKKFSPKKAKKKRGQKELNQSWDITNSDSRCKSNSTGYFSVIKVESVFFF